MALGPHGGTPLAELGLPDPVTFVLGAERGGCRTTCSALREYWFQKPGLHDPHPGWGE